MKYSCLWDLAFNFPYSILKSIMEVWYFDNTLAQLWHKNSNTYKLVNYIF